MMRRAWSILICVAGAVAAGPGVGRAAEDAYVSGFYTRGVDAAANIDQGGAVADPFYVPVQTGALLPRVTLAATRDDNVFLDPTNATVGTSLELMPGLLAIWGRPAGNHVYADAGMILPLYESDDNVGQDPSLLLRLGGVIRTGKSQLLSEFGYRRLEDTDAMVGARLAKQDWFGDLNGEHRISGKSSVGALARLERHEFDEETYLDYDRYYGAGRLYHRVSAKSETFFQGGIGRDEPRAVDSAAADFYDLSLGVRGKQSPKFNASGRVGYMWRIYDAETRGDYAHWIASLRAESTPFGLTTFSGEVHADVRPAVDAADADAVDQNVVLGASRRLFTERLRGTVSTTFGQIDYSGGSAEEAGGRDGRTDRYWGFSVGADWWSKERFSVGAAYSYMRRDGSVDGSAEMQDATSYEQGRWTLRASWNY